jgi:gamma-glutamyl:cysteine ligase YbdK (ATP-grasp superfamily)
MAKISINKIVKEVNEIKTKAENSEKIVKEISKDIKTLDIAQKNIKSVIEILDRLRSLSNSIMIFLLFY